VENEHEQLPILWVAFVEYKQLPRPPQATLLILTQSSKINGFAVALGTGVAVALVVAVGVGVAAGVAVGAVVGALVALGVALGVGLGVAVCVAVGVGVGVLVSLLLLLWSNFITISCHLCFRERSPAAWLGAQSSATTSTLRHKTLV
jgi:hypothetical protein